MAGAGAPSHLRPLTGRVYRSANFRTLGIGESAVSQLLDELTRRPQPYVGTYAKDDGVHVRVTASADDPARGRTRPSRNPGGGAPSTRRPRLRR